ncbi:meiosis 1 arrest protein [Betta splendens]|uniref:Meiosis 1 arrest protein n=1 Tax=Betta splendens TaxID=158456 RepID=A0A9W2XMG7_BETSP|nr:meiosis 1 arrest protein [Betta splendens]XP_055363116.1 meiosis 1 arrest protein [Betta splendens]XP_055363117.1 meiosis 1 arrest protein [Betta splendens]
MNNRKWPAGSSSSGNLVFCSSSFKRQPARVLIVDALPPWWSDTRVVICDALDNFLSLACGLYGPCRIPLFSLYAVSRQQECLLPFVQVHGNLARLRTCVEELRSIQGEGYIRGPARGGELLLQTVLDSLQQFKQYMRHTSTGNPSGNNISVEVTVVTSQPGQAIVHQLEMGLKDADLASLKRLLVVHIYSARDWSQVGSLPEATRTETEECLMLGTEVDMQQVENNVFSMETVLKAWLQEQGGDREHLHLLLPDRLESPVCVKCDMQERLISPALIPLSPALGARTESVQDFLPVSRRSASQNPPQRLKAIKSLRADGVCESVMYGLPLVLCPTTCWQLDWDEMEANHNLFHALCHTLRSRDLFLLLQVEPVQRSAAEGSGVYSHYILQPSPSLSLLLKPVVSRELLLPCSLPVSNQDPVPDAMHTIQGCLTQLDEEFLFNPLSVSSNLYQHLRSRGLLSQPRYPYRLQPLAAHREQSQAAEGPKSTGRHARQNQGRQLGTNSRARATVAPLPSSSSLSSSVRPPPAKASRPALMLLSSSGSRRAPPPSQLDKDSKDDDFVVAQ